MARPSPYVVTANDGIEPSLCGWRVQPALNRVVKDGAEVRLEPRVMQVLACLLTADGEPVTRDLLMQQVWGHEYVTEDALNRTVSKLRRLLTDELHCNAEIETIPKTGYRLVQPDGAAPAGTQSASAPLHPLRRHGWWVAALVVAVAALVAFWPHDLHRSQDVATDGQARFLPLTTLGGKEIQPTLSPDGSRVAFSWRAQPGDIYHIFVRPIASDSLLQITQGQVNEFRPAWSPTGDQIAYALMQDDLSCVLMSVSSVGGPPRRLVDCDKEIGRAHV